MRNVKRGEERRGRKKEELTENVREGVGRRRREKSEKERRARKYRRGR